MDILLVDDSVTIRIKFKNYLSEKGFFIHEAANGVEALEILKNNPSIKLVISDINLPIMDGMTFIEFARLSENSKFNICLLEAGGWGSNILFRAPAGGLLMLRDKPKFNNWAFHTIPQKGLNGRKGYQPRGKALGGSSAINAMIYTIYIVLLNLCCIKPW